MNDSEANACGAGLQGVRVGPPHSLGTPFELSGRAYQVTARAYRKAMVKHDFSEPARLVLDVVILFGLERGQLQSLIPQQKCFCAYCGLTRSQVSEAVDWLERARVLTVEKMARTKGRRWDLYTLRPPDEWRVPLRAKETRQREELEAWLDRVAPDQPELMPPAPSLDDLLVEGFVESTSRSPDEAGAGVERVARALQSDNDGLQGSSFAGPEGTAVDGKVRPERTSKFAGSEQSGEKVTRERTLSREPIYTRAGASIDLGSINRSRSTDLNRDRLIEGDQAAEAQRRQGSEFRDYVEDRLFRLIGAHEREGQCGILWLRALDEMPEKLNELVSAVEAMRRENKLKSTPARWLNRCVHNAMGMGRRE